MSCRSAAPSGFCTKHEPALMSDWCDAVNWKNVRVWECDRWLFFFSYVFLTLCLLMPPAALHQFWPVRGSQASLVASQAGGEQPASGLWILFIPFLSDSLGFGFWCFFANSFQKKNASCKQIQQPGLSTYRQSRQSGEMEMEMESLLWNIELYLCWITQIICSLLQTSY